MQARCRKEQTPLVDGLTPCWYHRYQEVRCEDLVVHG